MKRYAVVVFGWNLPNIIDNLSICIDSMSMVLSKKEFDWSGLERLSANILDFNRHNVGRYNTDKRNKIQKNLRNIPSEINIMRGL